jgi:putrescine transport system permease protein
VIPELLGGPDTFMIGRILWMEFFNNRDWPLASALAVILLILFVIPIIVLQRFEERKQS